MLCQTLAMGFAEAFYTASRAALRRLWCRPTLRQAVVARRNRPRPSVSQSVSSLCPTSARFLARALALLCSWAWTPRVRDVLLGVLARGGAAAALIPDLVKDGL